MVKPYLTDIMKLRIRRLFARMGLEVATFTGSFAEHRLKLLNELSIRTVWDVGAHVGQYGSSLRDHGYGGNIVSLEPATEAFEMLQRTAQRHERWAVIHTAAGSIEDHLVLNISANGQSSSLLPMLAVHTVAAPESAYIGSEAVSVRTLDALANQLALPGPLALKLDVQGFEMSALAGATRLLEECALVEVELSLQPLYQGGANWQDVINHLADNSLTLCDIDRVYYEPASGDLLQIDGLFRRPT